MTFLDVVKIDRFQPFEAVSGKRNRKDSALNSVSLPDEAKKIVTGDVTEKNVSKSKENKEPKKEQS